MAGTITIFGQV